MSSKKIKKPVFLLFTLISSMLINSCTALKSCDCPGLQGQNNTIENTKHS